MSSRLTLSQSKIDGCPCKSDACFEVNAGIAKLQTRRLNAEHDKVCGNEYAFYPPMVQNVKVLPAGEFVNQSFRGEGLGALSGPTRIAGRRTSGRSRSSKSNPKDEG